MNTLKVDEAQPLLQPKEGDVVECRNEKGAMQVICNFRLLKSFELMQSGLTIFTSNIKLMFLMIFSIIPFFIFMVFFEIKLQKAIVVAPSVIRDPFRANSITLVSFSNGTSYVTGGPELDHNNIRKKFLFDVVQLCSLYLVVYPLLELLSMTTVIIIAAKVYAGEKTVTLKEAFYRKINLKGVLVNCLFVHLLSFLTLVGLIWTVGNHLMFTSNSHISFYDFQQSVLYYCWYVVSLGIHSMVFVALLYMYLHWSAFWNLTMVISVLEEETGLDAFGMADYYGKHRKPTGFQLMLGSVGLSTVLRLACLGVNNGSSNSSVVGVTSVVTGLVCLGNLVRWVAFVLYYFDCKQQTMEKKNDLELGKTANIA